MRNPVLAITISFVLAAPCIALAGGKKDTIEIQSYQHQVTQPASSSGGTARVGSPTIKVPTGSTGPTKPGSDLKANKGR